MKISKDARKGARELFRACFTNGRLDLVKVRSAVSFVLEKKPAARSEILHEYHRLVRIEVDRRTAVVESAVTLAAGERQSIESLLKTSFGDDVHLNFSEDSNLIAGLRVRVGSDVIESSVRDRLFRLRRQIDR